MNPKSSVQSVVGLILASLVVACGNDLASEQKRLDQFVAGNQVGSSNDYWLELFNLSGEWERVALVTGYYDDYSGCMDIAQNLMKEFGRQYRCMPAN